MGTHSLLERAGALELSGPSSTPVDQSGGSFAFRAHQAARPGAPVAYDPCRPIEIHVNRDIAPPGSDHIVQEAVDQVAAATGLHLVLASATHDLPTRSRSKTIYGAPAQGAQPVLVAWTTDDRIPRLRGDVIGLGGSAWVWDPSTGLRRYVSGTVSLDTPALRRMLARPDGHALARAVVMHELGHVVGLAHVHDTDEIMSGQNVGQTSFGPGDLRGLKALGEGHCFG